MSFFSLLTAFALEHWRPRRSPFSFYQTFARLVVFLREKLDGGEPSHGFLAWCCAVLVPVLLAAWIAHWLAQLWTPLAWAWSVGVLYATTGFRYYTLKAEEIALLLRAGEVQTAQARLADWRGLPADDAHTSPQAQTIAGQTIARLFGHSLRQTFGVLCWFVLLGPAGAVLYRLSSVLTRRLGDASEGFRKWPGLLFHLLNWLPARLTAMTYAVAGNFEDAMYGWRTRSTLWPDAEEGVVVSAGAGAMGVRLDQEQTGIGSGEPPDADQIDSAVSMIWRGLMVWVVAGLLLTVTGWVNA